MKKLDIIYEDKNLLVVNKPTKMLTISDGKVVNTLYSMARTYVKKQHKSNKIFIVHRLDKDTSGVIVFAKSEKIKNYLQENWNEIAKREYIGIVAGKLSQDRGIIKEYLKEDKTHRVYASKIGDYGQTSYEVLNKNNKYSVVKINIKTGKKHQIRVGFSNLGHPILGDKLYGSKNNFLKRLALHATKLELIMPDKIYHFECKVPREFTRFLK